MIERALRVVVLLGSGVLAGVLFAVALSVLPGLSAMPPDRYVYAHRLIGRNWDPTMPVIVLTSALVDLALMTLAPSVTVAALCAGAAVLLIGVAVVSHFCNVPINRQVKALDPGRLPLDWRDPRPLWRRWHALRTVLAILALLTNAVAVTLS
jgi:uncharacterized membrane protein